MASPGKHPLLISLEVNALREFQEELREARQPGRAQGRSPWKPREEPREEPMEPGSQEEPWQPREEPGSQEEPREEALKRHRYLAKARKRLLKGRAREEPGSQGPYKAIRGLLRPLREL